MTNNFLSLNAIKELLNMKECTEYKLLISVLSRKHLMLSVDDLMTVSHLCDPYYYWEYIADVYPEKIRKEIYLKYLKLNKDLFWVSTYASDETFSVSVLPILLHAYSQTRDPLIRRDLIITIGNIQERSAIDILLKKEKITKNTTIRSGILISLLKNRHWEFFAKTAQLLQETNVYQDKCYIYNELANIYRENKQEVFNMDLFDIDRLIKLWQQEGIAVKEALLILIIEIMNCDNYRFGN